MNVIARLDFELGYYSVVVQHVSHFATRILPSFSWVSLPIENPQEILAILITTITSTPHNWFSECLDTFRTDLEHSFKQRGFKIHLFIVIQLSCCLPVLSCKSRTRLQRPMTSIVYFMKRLIQYVQRSICLQPHLYTNTYICVHILKYMQVYACCQKFQVVLKQWPS